MTAAERRVLLIKECVYSSLQKINPVAVDQVIFRLFQVWQYARMPLEAKYKAIAHELAITEPNDRLLLLKFHEHGFNWVRMEVDHLHHPIQLQNNDLNHKFYLPENDNDTAMDYFHRSANFACSRKELRNQYVVFRAAVREFGRGHNILEQRDLEPIENEQEFGSLRFLDYPFDERDLTMLANEPLYESLLVDVQQSDSPFRDEPDTESLFDSPDDPPDDCFS
jgi:hypothetical protein